MFYYKLNLFYANYKWIDQRDKKNFISPQWFRNIKGKKYSKWRLDTFFSKKKYSNLLFVKDGGWHFTCLKSPEELERKLLNFAHHYEFQESKLKLNDIKKMVKERRALYDTMLINKILNGLVKLFCKKLGTVLFQVMLQII